MRSKHRQFLSYVQLATYASISLIGDGLHGLLPDGHHHHHGLYVVDHSCNDRQHSDYAQGEVACCGSEFAGLTAVDLDAESHLCEICVFLIHAISQPAEVAATIDWQPLVVVAQADPQPVYSLTSLGPQAARGPPFFLA
jgi:hypothetical protein